MFNSGGIKNSVSIKFKINICEISMNKSSNHNILILVIMSYMKETFIVIKK